MRQHVLSQPAGRRERLAEVADVVPGSGHAHDH